jgi:hypothetical protein
LFVSTAAQNFTLAPTGTLWNGFTFSIFAMAGPASVGVGGSDAINGGTAGVGATIPAGSAAQFRTDGAGNWFMTVEQASRGIGTIASASTVDLCSVPNPYLTVTGTASITSFGASCQAGQTKILNFAAGIKLTQNATSLILPNNGQNITTTNGDTAFVVALGGGNYIVTDYQLASGSASPSGARPLAITGLLPSSIAGLSGSASLSISSGYATDATNAVQIAAPSTLNWYAANGSSINGIAGGGTLSASATIHFVLCDGGSGVGSMATGIWPVSTAECPSGYNTYARYIFSINTTAAATPLSGTAIETDGGGYDFYYSAILTDFVSGSIATGGTLISVTVPSGPNVTWIGRAQSGSGNGVCIESPYASIACAASAFDLAEAADFAASAQFRILTNSTAQIRASATGATTGYAQTLGYHNARRY